MVKIKKIETQVNKEDNRIILSDNSIINFEYSRFGSQKNIDAEIKVFDQDWNKTHHLYIVRHCDNVDNCFITIKDLLSDNTITKEYDINFKQFNRPTKDFIFRKAVEYLNELNIMKLENDYYEAKAYMEVIELNEIDQLNKWVELHEYQDSNEAKKRLSECKESYQSVINKYGTFNDYELYLDEIEVI